MHGILLLALFTVSVKETQAVRGQTARAFLSGCSHILQAIPNFTEIGKVCSTELLGSVTWHLRWYAENKKQGYQTLSWTSPSSRLFTV
jgi:hypothetical protein